MDLEMAAEAAGLTPRQRLILKRLAAGWTLMGFTNAPEIMLTAPTPNGNCPNCYDGMMIRAKTLAPLAGHGWWEDGKATAKCRAMFASPTSPSPARPA